MNNKDKEIMEMLLKDKGEKYSIIVDNDSVSVYEKGDDGEKIHTFSNFGDYLIKDIFDFLGMDAEMC